MPKLAKPLTATRLLAAKPRSAPYQISDGRGLFLAVMPVGSRLWRFRYRSPINRARNTLSLGQFPEVSLEMARERREALRRELAQGREPSHGPKVTTTFRFLADEWYAKKAPGWSESHCRIVRDRLDRDVFPYLGDLPIAAVDAPTVLACLRRIESRHALDTAHRVCGYISAICRYAVAIGEGTTDPTTALRGALESAPIIHRASLTQPKEVGALLRAIDDYSGHFVVAQALKLAPLVFVRPGELRAAEWSEFNLEAAEWRIPAARMKMRAEHLVPLSRQAIAILKELQPLTGSGRYLFPSLRTDTRSMSENALNAALRRMGFDKTQMTAHGFRSIASTLLNELNYRPDVIERQLAHTPKDKVRSSYNFATHLPERRAMMQEWADYLDSLRQGAQVVTIREGKYA